MDSLHKGPVTRDFDAFFVVSPMNCWKNSRVAGKGPIMWKASWRHHKWSTRPCNISHSSMMTSSNGNISALLAVCEGSPVNSLHKGQWRGALKFSLICAWTNGWANNRDTGDLRRYRADCDVSVISTVLSALLQLWTDCVLKIVILYTKKEARQNERFLVSWLVLCICSRTLGSFWSRSLKELASVTANFGTEKYQYQHAW